MGDSLRRAIAGSSGPFYATALLRAARRLAGQQEPDVEAWGLAFEDAVASCARSGALSPAIARW